MATKIRLARGGAKKKPYYRIVVADIRMPRDGRYIEKIGTFDPMLPKNDENRLKVVQERVDFWISTGATPTDRVQKLFADNNVIKLTKKQIEKKEARIKAVQEKLAKIKAAEEAAKKAEEAANAPAEEPKAEEPAEEAKAE